MLARSARIPLLVASAVVVFLLLRHWPTDQTLRIVLGDAAPRVEEVRVRYAEPTGGHDDWEREVTFHYAPGLAPRIVSHEPRLVSGEYDVEVEITLTPRPLDPTFVRTVTEARRVTLRGGTTSIDVSQRALGGGGRP